MQLQVMNSPFSQEQSELLNRLLSTLTEPQKMWLSGYLAGAAGTVLPQVSESGLVSQQAGSAPSKEVTVLFGSQTGNAQGLAESVTAKLKERGFQVTLAPMNEFKANSIKKVQNLLILVSTHGEGDPPDNALSLYEFLHGRRAPQLKDLRFSVLSLGDSSYEFFCKTGKDFDKRLEELGGQRLYPRFDCDLDYDEAAAEWLEGVLNSLSETKAEEAFSPLAPVGAGALTEQSVYSRTNPFKAEILENINLNGRGSNKETRHLELSLEGSNLEFEPGDSLGIYPENDPELVDQIIQKMNWNSDEIITVNKQGETRSLRESLISYYEITVLTKPLLQKAAELTSDDQLQQLLSPGKEEELRAYMEGRDLLDLVQDFKFEEVPVSTFVSILRKMPARLYSISSSLRANPDEVHLTIGTVRYDAHGRSRKGVCSIQC
ncbi:MAG TPA: sulfite reductase flavoprotein subunit alpha, partial [Pseudobacillus sp.]